ncbi:hypothetical protein FB565_008282 [Actinoplanes lutulentus]|uniref:Uncharacterized protein n=1 Tax=Actinoplanes lutulentus TaxID=1287878 RepID=A0A327Z7Z9_9ACTN|nr:hypothetical protein [Actinoplanes lutulentus]MBB2948499.1 hypothetical protein [Actinoplanes lutulentus]RAK34469.1 hypothetical protein B0I29_11168 [Actinoplanes lutulentus]
MKARHTRLKSLRDEIVKAGEARQYALAYLVLHRDFEPALTGEPALVATGDLPKSLLTALTSLGDAEKDLADKERTVTAKKAALDTAKAALDDHTKNSGTRLRQEMKDKPVPSAPAPAPAPASAERKK